MFKLKLEQVYISVKYLQPRHRHVGFMEVENPQDLRLHHGISQSQFHDIPHRQGRFSEYLYAQSAFRKIYRARLQVLSLIGKKKGNLFSLPDITSFLGPVFAAEKKSAVRTWFKGFYRRTI